MSDLTTIQRTFYKVADFISWTKKEGLKLSPNFQRRAVWNKGAKSYLIDTIYKGLPVPIIFLRDRGIDKKNYEPIREVIDGQQRLRTLISFIAPSLLRDFNPNHDEFLVNKSHNAELANRKFDDLDPEDQFKILNYEFNVHILSSSVSDRDVIQIFRRMNSTNYVLNKQEILNSQYFGGFKISQYQLAAEQLERWRQWKTFSESDITRMQEVELTSELTISMHERRIQGKSASQIENYYKKYDESYPFRDVIEDRFRNTMDYIYKTFKENKNEFVFFKKTLFYTFFMKTYDSLYNLNENPNSATLPAKISAEKINEIIVKSDRIRDRVAPSDVLEATDRRTTNPREREILFKYLASENA